MTFYLATVDGGEIQSSEEHDAIRWAGIEEAITLLAFDSLRRIYRLAHEQL